MVGAFAALILVYVVSTRGGTTPVGTLLLMGIADVAVQWLSLLLSQHRELADRKKLSFG
jgi:ABC-type Fe3+-siderophore transport system permease subunit